LNSDSRVKDSDLGLRGLVKTVLGDLRVISRVLDLHIFVWSRAFSAQRPFCYFSFSQFSRQLVTSNTFAYVYEFWLEDFMTRRRLDVPFTQTGQRVFKRQGYMPQICISRIPAFAFWHIPPKNKGSSSASTTDEQLTSLIYFANDSELLTFHFERINLSS
jgi:hypothetical protein